MNHLSAAPRRKHLVGWTVIVSSAGRQEIRKKVARSLDAFVGDYGSIKVTEGAEGFGFGLWKPEVALPMTTWSYSCDARHVGFIEGVFYDDYGSHRIVEGEDNGLARALAHAVKAEGEGAIARLSGSFAGFVFEPDTRTLHTFVDRLGTKALYWSWEEGDLIVASNLAVFRGLKSLSVDQVAAFQFVTIGFPVGERTLLEDVRVQLPCSVNTFRETGYRSVRYWEVPARVKRMVLRDSVEMISQSVEECVDRLAARANQPVGLGLTGGHDSRVVFSSLLYRKLPFEVVVWRDHDFNDRVVNQLCSIVGKEPHVVGEISEAEAQADKKTQFAYSEGQYLYAWGFLSLANRCRQEGLGCLLLGYSGDWISGSYAVPAAQYLRNIEQLVKSSLAYQMELLSFADAGGVLGDMPRALIAEGIAEWRDSFVREASAGSLSHVEIWQAFANRNFKRLRYAMAPALTSVQLLFPYLDNKVLETYFSLPERAFYLQRAHCYAGFNRFSEFGNYQTGGYPVSLKIESRFPTALYLMRLARTRMQPVLSLVDRFGGTEKWGAGDEDAYRELMQSAAVNRYWLAALRRNGKLSLKSLRRTQTLSRSIDFYVRGENRHLPEGFLRE